MGRHKKNLENEPKIESENEKMHFNIHSDAKRSVAAIFLFSLAILFIFGFFDGAGVLGEYLNKIGGSIFGWGKWLFPFVLAVAGVVLLLRKKTSYYVTKLVGLALAFLSVLGFFHIFFDAEKFSKIAKAGEGGGYIGMAVAYILIKFTGEAAGIVILSAIFLMGMIVAFNFSLVELWQKIFSSSKSEKKIEDDSMENINKDEGSDNVKLEEKKEQKEDNSSSVNEIIAKEQKEDIGNNIKKIEFVENSEEDARGDIEDGRGAREKKLLGTGATHLRTGKSGAKKGFSSHAIGNNWQLPPLGILEVSTGKAQGGDIEKKAEIIKRTFSYFGIEVEEGDILVGPTVTQYSFRPAVGVKLSRITSLGADLSLALAAHPIRIEAPIPGKSLIGIEVPNKTVASVRMRDALEDILFRDSNSTMNLILGKNVGGKFVFKDLRKMPHLLVAGATGREKAFV
ncbi:MAG: DNA translocase FtsK 4TM domain-containing protein [Candidatus Moranbacteria bacterium]|jgi:S-DNA-T family DNA segregation ATPase FtsK/SpoIIIE|nr:DNA translocase FtsK 4TM domain-containing protein [Candidatus Moranbacteria bacterium]